MKDQAPFIIYTSDPSSSQVLAWAKQQLPWHEPEVRPLHQLGTVIITPAAPAPKSL